MVKLLTVDDEEGVRDFIRKFFSSRGYTVLAASSGEQALSIVEKEQPKIVFLDISMPGMDGLEVLGRIKKIDSGITVLMVTVMADQKTKEKAKELGADEFIKKPFNQRYLEDVVLKKMIELAG